MIEPARKDTLNEEPMSYSGGRRSEKSVDDESGGP